MSKVRCENCLSPDLTLEHFTSGYGELTCNECKMKTQLSVHEVDEVIEMSWPSKGIMQATICYDSSESATGPMTLKMLQDAVEEAVQKGMPLDAEVFESSTEAPVNGVRFLFETEKIIPKDNNLLISSVYEG